MEQLLNYSEPPFCRIFRDLDILFLQFFTSSYGPRKLLNHLAHAFSVHPFLQMPLSMANNFTAIVISKDGLPMLDEFLLLLNIIVTELPLALVGGGDTSKSYSVKQTLRRECMEFNVIYILADYLFFRHT